MTIAVLKRVESYKDIWDFTKDYINEIKELFKEELKDLKIKNNETEEEAIARHLIEKGFCDEEVIRAVLNNDKRKKYFVQFIEDNNFGYFEIYEVGLR